jgi:hypothetical protein
MDRHQLSFYEHIVRLFMRRNRTIGAGANGDPPVCPEKDRTGACIQLRA